MLKKAFVQLLKIKSLVTLVATVVFAYLSVTGKIDADKFMNLYLIIIAFYFGSQTGKREAEAEKALEEEEKEVIRTS